MFYRYFKNESARMFKSYKFYLVIILFLLFTLSLALYFTFSDGNNNEKTVYGVIEYSSFEELNQRLSENINLLKKEQETLKNSILNDALSDQQIKTRQSKIDNLTRLITVMNYLYKNKIEFSSVTQYNSFEKDNANCFFNNTLIVLTYFIGFMTIIRIISSLISEIKEGTAKLTLTLPVTRFKYALYKFLTYYLQSLIFFVLCMLGILLIATSFFSTNGLILFAAKDFAFSLNIILAMIIQFCFSSVTLLGYCSIIFSIALLINNKIIALLVSTLLCFSGSVIDFIKNNFLALPTMFFKYFISCNLKIENCFIYTDANNIFTSLAVVALSSILIFAIAFFKFSKQDIKN